MDAFESIIAEILERDGFWVRNNFKVELTKEDKCAIGRPSSPRWELDILAYRPKDNQLWLVECKSYLNSRGVDVKAFKPGARYNSRYKLFTDTTLRDVVTARLVDQLNSKKSIRKSPKIKLCLAAGNIVESTRSDLDKIFKENGWSLFGRDWILEKLKEIANDGYENSIAAMTAKLLLRK